MSTGVGASGDAAQAGPSELPVGAVAATGAPPLQPATLPLRGSQLIEASAGTGKTWTIAALYVRLVLGHGDRGTAYLRPLQPSEILVMTFTVAATRELSDRIRRRLIEAARAFRAADEEPVGDAFFAELLAGYPDRAERDHAAWRLDMAAQAMDDAAVHTIDAWCQRMLRDHAFDSGCLFDEELSPDDTVMIDEAARDYWRLQVYPLQGAALDAVLMVWKDAAQLMEEARQLVWQAWPEQRDEASLAGLVDRLLAQRTAEQAALKAGWVERARDMGAWIEAQLASASCPFDGRRLGGKHSRRWLDALALWAGDPHLDRPDMKAGAQRFTPDGMRDALKTGRTVELPEHFAAFAELMAALDRRESFAVSLRPHAARHIAARMAELKQQARRFGFADMLERLDRALDPARNGAHAERLRRSILARHPVALIDEFQDTSPVQLRIFDRLYRIADNDPSTALLLIGDPKQSIYRFRGADIHSYLVARRETQGRHHRLTTNHRSTGAVVSAVNRLFSRAEGRAYPRDSGMSQGAFMYAVADDAAAGDADAESNAGTGAGANVGANVGANARAGADAGAAGANSGASADVIAGAGAAAAAANPLPYVEVNARGRAEQLRESAGAVVAMQLVLESGTGDAAGIRRRFAQRCAERIAALLGDPQAGFVDPQRGFVPLRPADIAVLVRTGREANEVRRELQRRRIASVYLSDQDSVFASNEARDLLHWLRAVAQPLDARLVRAALATGTIGLPMAELALLAADDQAFDARTDQLVRLHAVWQSQGVLTMLRRCLHDLELPARWLAGGGGAVDGERRLTNFLHLAELLQAASAQLDGEQALIRWLAVQVADAQVAGDQERIVRLESDADLVQVITVHKSKGLEYPVVFLPFAYSFRAVEKGDALFVDLIDDVTGERRLVLDPDDRQLAAADRDRLREDLRLLYVALTRARHALWVGLAAQASGRGGGNQWHRSAAGRLLGNGLEVDAAELPDQVAALVDGCDAIALQLVDPDEPIGCTLATRQQALPPLRQVPDYAAEFERSWRIGSFSALVRDLPPAVARRAVEVPLDDDEAPIADPTAEPRRAEVQPPGSSEQQPVPTTLDLFAAEPWHRFPRGSLPGNFLHDQLEWLAGEGFALAESSELAAQLLRRCERQGWGHRSRDVIDWLRVIAATELPALGASLASVVSRGAALPEMEFWFGSEGVTADRIDALCREHLLGGRERPALPRRELNGLLMGFADLVFEHEGRYWVLDYKSNWLGDGDAAYHPAALEAAMASHRYDVQAAIYLLALHRLLRSRLGASYDPARQLGGAIYLFLRGINGPTRGCHVVAPPLVMLEQLDVLLGAASAATSSVPAR